MPKFDHLLTDSLTVKNRKRQAYAVLAPQEGLGKISNERRRRRMEQNTYPPGTLVQVTSYGPFRGLRGTVKVVDSISDGDDVPFCFYLIVLEGTQMKEPMWFECNEVGLVALPNINLEV